MYDAFALQLNKVDKTYLGAIIGDDGNWKFPSKAAREECRKASEVYFDNVVQFKEFVEDNPTLRIALARRLLNYAKNEGFNFDWHYWQLFRRKLDSDLLDPESSLAIIQYGESSSEEEESWDE